LGEIARLAARKQGAARCTLEQVTQYGAPGCCHESDPRGTVDTLWPRRLDSNSGIHDEEDGVICCSGGNYVKRRSLATLNDSYPLH
jgi:hypothetical protein